jgi:hypothetical protein
MAVKPLTIEDCGLPGRRIGGLHESLLDINPTGQEAADFW